MTLQIAPFGQWISPISADHIVDHSVKLGTIVVDGDAIFWSESRPLEQGRSVVVQSIEGQGHRDCLPAPYSARSRVHEYGGSAFTIYKDTLFFVNHQDQQWYRLPLGGGAPEAMTQLPRWRFADPVIDPKRQRLLCIGEEHSEAGEPRNCLVALPLEARDQTAPPQVLASGCDFYASPTLTRDGERLAWLSWNHPHMPWDQTQLFVSGIDAAGRLLAPVRIAGGKGESIFQPRWGSDNSLYFVSDQSGFWNLRRFDGQAIKPIAPMAAEFGLPQWAFGLSTYALADDGTLFAAYNQLGRWQLGRISRDGRLFPLDLPYTEIDSLQMAGRRLVFRAGAPIESDAIIAMDSQSQRREVLRQETRLLDPEELSFPEVIAFPTHAPEEEQTTAYAFFYPPKNARFRGPDGERPPLLVKCHGGPTGAAEAVFRPQIQYWTSRGFAVLDVNYRGSTGFGRAYREALYGHWGVFDVADCISAARWACEAGRSDERRCAIRGNSAGGYTALAALTFGDFFSAGASYYGIGDLEALLRDTHKFESRYLDKLIGPYPEQQALYRQRSPLYHSQQLSAPVIFFQGLKDQVVPPNQAQQMVEALRHKQIPVAYVPFAEEYHGFRHAANIKRALEGELYFYGQVFRFQPADEIAPVEIAPLPPP